jgi:hypothetical protein
MEPQTKTNAEHRSAPPAQGAARTRAKGQLLPFPTLKRPRGRPRKDRTPCPAPESFDVIANAIVGLNASEHVWRRAATQQRLAMQQRRLRPTTIAVMDFVTEHINRTDGHGYDWHEEAEIAEILGVEKRSVKRAFHEAGDTGFAKRRRHGNRWDTTLPQMIGLCTDVRRQLDAEQPRKEGTRKGARGDQKIRGGTRKSAGGPENGFPQGQQGTKKAEAGDQKGKNQPLPPSSPPYPPSIPHPANPKNNPISALPRAMSESGFQGLPIVRPEPRFDRSLALPQRINTWPLGLPQEAEAAKLYARMRRLAKGWDCEALKQRFCNWMEAKPAPNDAMEAFIGWVGKYAAAASMRAAPAGQERANDPRSLAEQWRAEDAADADLRAPVWGAGSGTKRPVGVGGLVSSVVSRVGAQGVQ